MVKRQDFINTEPEIKRENQVEKYNKCQTFQKRFFVLKVAKQLAES